jgi:ElaB/YqjD/DUF883 family membrane-anchored ribosome-binding protein
MTDEQSGFRKLTDVAGDSLVREDIGTSLTAGAKDMARQASGALKAVGIDTDGAVEIAEERVFDLQTMLMNEVRERPLRALGWAVGAGFVLGILSAR